MQRGLLGGMITVINKSDAYVWIGIKKQNNINITNNRKCELYIWVNVNQDKVRDRFYSP